jgi:hypothetical protein
MTRFSSLVLLSAAFLTAEETSRLAPLRAVANWEIGRIEKGYYYGGDREFQEVINHATVWTLQVMRLSDRAKAFIGVGGAYFFVFPRNIGQNPYSMSKRSGFGITDAHGEFTFLPGEGEDHGLRLKAGIFPYKGNPDARNLGEYLYRTWTYPTIITGGGLDFANSASTQLSGIAAHTSWKGFENEVLLTTQTDRAPVLGLSLADVVSYTFGGILTLGAGFMFDNFYVADSNEVRPGLALDNKYFTLSNGDRMASREYKDLEAKGLLPTGVTPVDTSLYTFAGQKASFRAALELGRLISDSWFAEGELRLYAEAILMGLKDYPTYYEKLSERTAYMFGLNLPTFRLLDLLAVELEYCANPFENSTRGPYGVGAAAPFVEPSPNEFPNPRRITADDWKWSVLARKQVYPGFAVQAQAASDHIKTLDVYSTPDFYDILKTKSHWYWVVKLTYSI